MIQSVVRTMKILEALSGPQKKYSIAELGQITSLPNSTVHRILKTLLSQSYVSKDVNTHLYYLGHGLIPLGAKAAEQTNLTESASFILRKLSQETGEDSYLVIKSGNKGLVIQTVEGSHPLKIVDRYGSEVELHCGAIRKALLAYQSEEFIKNYINSELKQYTNKTLIKANDLLISLNEIKQHKVSVSVGEYIKDGVGIGSPVLNSEGLAIASLGIIVPLARTDDDRIKELKNKVKEAAKLLQLRLGYL